MIFLLSRLGHKSGLAAALRVVPLRDPGKLEAHRGVVRGGSGSQAHELTGLHLHSHLNCIGSDFGISLIDRAIRTLKESAVAQVMVMIISDSICESRSIAFQS